MAKITIRVGAAADASLRNAYLPLVAAANLARQQVAAQMRGLATMQIRESERASRAQAKAANDGARDAYRAQKSANDAIIRERQKQVSSELRDFDKRVRASKRAADAEEKDILRVAAAAEKAEARKAKAAKSAAQSRRSAIANEFGGRAVSNIGNLSNGARRVGNEIVNGLGVNADISSNISKGVSLETSAVNTINSGFGAKGMSATQADVDKLINEIRATGDATSSDYNSTAAGLNAFVGKTGDLDAGRRTMTEMAKIAKATGGDVNEMMSAAGDVWNQLKAGPGDANEKAQTLLATMRLFAKQGQMGNVEIKDLAVHMGRVSSSAFKYTGDRDKNLGILGALAQMAKLGGASSGAEAARGAGSFGRDISKSKALDRFDKEGIQIFADKGKTEFRNPEDIIVDVFRKTKGDNAQMSKLFQNDMSKKIMDGFGAIFKDAGGEEDTERGVQAIRDTFKSYTSSLSDKDVNQAFSLNQGTDAAKAQRFNNQLEKIASSMADKIVPELEKAAPHIAQFVATMAEWTAWAVANPFKAVAIALGASLLKAGIDTAIKNGIASLLKKALDGGGAPGATPGGGGKALPILAAGAAGVGVGIAMADAVMGGVDQATTERVSSDLRMMNAQRRGATLQDKISAKQDLERRISNAKEHSGVGGAMNYGGGSAALNWITSGSYGSSIKDQQSSKGDKANFDAMVVKLGVLHAEIAAMRAGTLNVNVLNQPTGANGAPGVDQGSRVGPGK